MGKIQRRDFMQNSLLGTAAAFAGLQSIFCESANSGQTTGRRPNILFAISDDQSWPYTGAYGDRTVRTPNFDRIAREGCLFTNCFAAAPQCSPSRAAILTGRNIWQIEEAGTHNSLFPKKWPVYTDLLEAAGYETGYTGKPWSPGNWKDGGWPHNPAGHEFNELNMKQVPADGISSTDYAGNFEAFYKQKANGKPFCFWYGAHEPHLRYEAGSGLKYGKKLEDANVPSFLPDTPVVRGDILDFSFEIDWFDTHLGRIINFLEEQGELDNTLILVTSDNGMPFPHAKANMYEQGTHVPLAIRWPERIAAGRTIGDITGFIDFAPTFLEACGLDIPNTMVGRSLMGILESGRDGLIDPAREFILNGRERHSHSRFDNLGYPCRAIRTQDYLYIRNFKPERWPAGDPDGYHDIDGSPTKSLITENWQDEDIRPYFDLGCAKRPLEELYDIKNDTGCLNNLADKPEYKETKEQLWSILENCLKEQKDPRVLGYGDIYESYPRFAHMREYLGGFWEKGKYNPRYHVEP